MASAQDFLSIPDLDLPEGTPVTGYKLFYRSAYSPDVLQRIVQGTSIMNADSVVRSKDEISTSDYVKTMYQSGDLTPVPGHENLLARRPYVYDETKPNVMTDNVKKDVGFFYWPDRGVAESYGEWYSNEFADRDFYGIPVDRPKGRYELHRVEGIHIPKPAEDPFGQDMNEGMTMNEMMIDSEVLAAWSMTGDRIDEKQSMKDWAAQEMKRVADYKAAHKDNDYSGWY